MDMIIEPLENYVLVKCEERETRELLLGKVEPLQKGRVIALGPNVSIINKGDNVLFSKYVGVDVDIENGILIMRQQDISAKFHEELEEMKGKREIMEDREGRLIQFIRAAWKCNHTAGGRVITENGLCPKCGCAADDYKFEVQGGDDLVVALNGYAFEHNHNIIWYKNALYELDLVPRPTHEEEWQPVEKAEKRK